MREYSRRRCQNETPNQRAKRLQKDCERRAKRRQQQQTGLQSQHPQLHHPRDNSAVQYAAQNMQQAAQIWQNQWQDEQQRQMRMQFQQPENYYPGMNSVPQYVPMNLQEIAQNSDF